MKIAIHNWMRAEPIEKTIARIASLGYDALEIESDTENDPPAYELISVSALEVDVTTEDAVVTVVFKITDETGLEERQLPSVEGATKWYQPGVLTEDFDRNVLYSVLERPVCQQSLYLDSPSTRAYRSYEDRNGDYDGDGTTERFLETRHYALNVSTFTPVTISIQFPFKLL